MSGVSKIYDYDECFRPQYHFSPPRNWMNDPNGMFYYDGEYHLFYQYNPFGNKWGHMSWGHAVSPDMVHWEHLPLALAEENGEMIFSGSGLVDWKNTSGFGIDGQPPLIAIYTGHVPGDPVRQYQCIAYSNDRGRSWTKYDGNPVLDIGKSDFRDPKVMWFEPGAYWVMTVALSVEKKIQFYESADLKSWNFLSEFGPAGSTEGLWECPDLFALSVDGDNSKVKWVLQVDIDSGSVGGGSGGQYFIGDFDGKFFKVDEANSPKFLTPESSPGKMLALWLDYGKDFYAAVSWSDIPEEDGRRLWLAWMSNWQYAQHVPTYPWRNAMSLPRSVELRTTASGIRLFQMPARELKQLRARHFQVAPFVMAADSKLDVVPEITSSLLELKVEFEVKDAQEFGLRLCESEFDETAIGIALSSSEIYVDRSKSGFVDFHDDFPGRHRAPFLPEALVRLHIFVDRSSLEVFVNDGRIVFTEIIFPGERSHGIELFSIGGSTGLLLFEGWTLKPSMKSGNRG